MNLRPDQTLLERGAGEGFFTELIRHKVKSITAIDIHRVMISRLKERFKNTDNVEIAFRDITLSKNFEHYDVVFGNIPFNRTAEIFRKLSNPTNRFDSCHLIVQTEAAYRIVGSTLLTEMGLYAYPFYEIRLGMSIPRWAYSPQPSVNTSLLHVMTRQSPLVSHHEIKTFRMFVKRVVRSGNRNLFRVLGDGISYKRWRAICAQVGIQPNDSRKALDMQKCVELFIAARPHSHTESQGQYRE